MKGGYKIRLTINGCSKKNLGYGHLLKAHFSVFKVENLGLNNSQGVDEEKTKGRIITKGGQKKKPRAE